MNDEQAILIAGGYGVVGEQLARRIRQRHPDIPLILAGRNPCAAQALTQELTNARALALDMNQAEPLGGLRVRAIIAVVNDAQNYLLQAALRTGTPYLDITRWTERMRTAVTLTKTEARLAPVMLSSAWMAGVAAVISADLASKLRRVERIDINVLYSLKDKAGPNSIEYMDRLSTPFEVRVEDKVCQVLPYTDPRQVHFPGGLKAKAYRFDTPDQLTLPETTGAATVAARIAFDDRWTMLLLLVMTRSGIWRWISGPRFAGLRRAMLFNPGQGAAHELEIEVSGRDSSNQARAFKASVIDPRGQTHLTALGTLIQLERLLGLDGAPQPAPGVVFPDTAPQTASALALLKQFGVSVCIEGMA